MILTKGNKIITRLFLGAIMVAIPVASHRVFARATSHTPLMDCRSNQGLHYAFYALSEYSPNPKFLVEWPGKGLLELPMSAYDLRSNYYYKAGAFPLYPKIMIGGSTRKTVSTSDHDLETFAFNTESATADPDSEHIAVRVSYAEFNGISLVRDQTDWLSCTINSRAVIGRGFALDAKEWTETTLPDAEVALFGRNLGSAGTTTAEEPVTELRGIKVLVERHTNVQIQSKLARLRYISHDQINLIVPQFTAADSLDGIPFYVFKVFQDGEELARGPIWVQEAQQSTK